jgi:hypothetical protein
MIEQTSQCPTCGSRDRGLYLPKCQDEYWIGKADTWHSISVQGTTNVVTSAPVGGREEVTQMPTGEAMKAEQKLTKAAFYAQVGGSLVVDLNEAIDIAEALSLELDALKKELQEKS